MGFLLCVGPRGLNNDLTEEMRLENGSELARDIFTSQSASADQVPVKARIRDALALVGCPNRRIDRLCITCCSPSQPSHHAR